MGSMRMNEDQAIYQGEYIFHKRDLLKKSKNIEGVRVPTALIKCVRSRDFNLPHKITDTFREFHHLMDEWDLKDELTSKYGNHWYSRSFDAILDYLGISLGEEFSMFFGGDSATGSLPIFDAVQTWDGPEQGGNICLVSRRYHRCNDPHLLADGPCLHQDRGKFSEEDLMRFFFRYYFDLLKEGYSHMYVHANYLHMSTYRKWWKASDPGRYNLLFGRF